MTYVCPRSVLITSGLNYEIMVFSLGLTLDWTMNYQTLAWAQLGPNLIHPQCVCIYMYVCMYMGLSYTLCNFVRVTPFFNGLLLLDLTM